MKNPKKTIVELLRRELAIAHTKYVKAMADQAASIAGKKVWEQNNPDDGCGGISRCPYNTHNAKDMVTACSKQYNEAKAAEHYAVNQLIEPRQWVVKVFDDLGDNEPDHKSFRTYNVPASTKVDAQMLAFVLDRGIENAKYTCNATIEQGEVELAKTYTAAEETSRPM